MANTELQQTYIRLQREVEQLETSGAQIAKQIESKREALEALKDHAPDAKPVKPALPAVSKLPSADEIAKVAPAAADKPAAK